MTVRRFRAPGRVNLMGDHTDYNDGFVLPIAIDRECVAAALPRDDGRISVASMGQFADIAVDGSVEPDAGAPEWAGLVAAIVRALAAHGCPPTGTGIEINSTVPQGSGLSSSAAFEVAIALALCDKLDVEGLARACQEAEQRATGVPSGIMDQLTSLAAVADAALLIDCRSLEREPVPLPEDLTILAVHSGVSRTLARTQYAERRAACEAAARRIGVPSLRDATLSDAGNDPIARHVVTENARVHETAKALRAHDLDSVGALFRESHASLRDDFRVSTPELDALVGALEDAGAYGARLTGAGFGGAVVAVADAKRADAIGSVGADDYRRRTNLEPTVYRCRAVDGAGPAD